MMKIQFYVRRSPWSDGVGINIIQTPREGGKRSRVTSMTLEEIVPGTYTPENSLDLDFTDAQQLMDELYGAGIRPTQANGSPGQVEALTNHLNDMRRLVFEPEVKLPPAEKGRW